MSEVKVSVVICCYTLDRLRDIHEAIASALNQTVMPFEVIVSVDHNQELFHVLKRELPHGVRIVLNDGDHGASATRNVGIQSATGDIVAFLDDDAIARSEWIENLVLPLDDKRVIGVGGKIEPQWPKRHAPFWFPEEFDFMLGGTAHKKLAMLPNGEIRNVNEGNAAFRREVFDTVGLMENSLGRCNAAEVKFDAIGGEGAEFCLRIKSRLPNSCLLFCPSAIVDHKVGTERATVRYIFHYAFREGITRAMIRRLASGYDENALCAENLFLRRLLFVSVPRRLRRFYSLSNCAQLFMIMANLSLIGAGYLRGKWKYRGSV